MPKARTRDVFVLLPGIMGSVLQRNGRDAWAISGKAMCRALLTLGGSISELTLGVDDPAVDDLGDGVFATRTMADAHIVPGFVRVDGYSIIRQMILTEFDVVEGSFTEPTPGDVRLERAGTYFDMPYDWRRDNRVSARRLKRLIDQALAERRKSVPDAKVVLLGHSMGGLVSRYYLECLGGAKDCRALVTFGTPYRGSVKAIDYLANGFRKVTEIGMLSRMARSFTAMYQLLPIYRGLQVGDVWQRVAETDDVPNIDRGRAEQALAFHREIETAVSARRATPEGASAYQLIPFVGTAQDTPLSATFAQGAVVTSSALPQWMDISHGEGDGTVPKVSAIPIEMEEAHETYIAARHGSIQQCPQVLEDLRHRLMRLQSSTLGAVRAPGYARPISRPELSLDVGDFFGREEAVPIVARIRGDGPAPKEVVATVSAADGRAAVVTRRMDRGAGGWVTQLSGMEPGLYRVEVDTRPAGLRAPVPVSELFEVAG